MDVCVFIEYLMSFRPSPATVKNKISVVRKYLTLAQGNLLGINSVWVKNSLDAISRTKYHSVQVKKPISVANLRKIILQLPQDFVSMNIKTMLLLLYYTAFRQSEIAPKKADSFDEENNLCKSDIKFKSGSLYINLRCAKNLQRFDEEREICIKPVSDHRLCPVYNLKEIFKSVHNKRPSDPVFVFKDKTPITVQYLRKRWIQSLEHLGLDYKDFSLHSIRKCSATHAFNMGFSSLEVQRYGGWGSNAHLRYIKSKSQRVISNALGQAIIS